MSSMTEMVSSARDSGGTPAGSTLGFWRSCWIIAALELRQRRRSKTLWILAIIWFVLIGLVTSAVWVFLSIVASADDASADTYPMFSLIVYFVLLFGSLVAPAISAASVNSERSGGTLATTQVTLVGTWAILLGKALAAWLTGLAFLLVAAPYVVLSFALSRAGWAQVLVALLGLALQIGILTVIGVGLSALITSPLFSIVTAYLVVAFLSLGTLITFGLAVATSIENVKTTDQRFTQEYYDATSKCGDDMDCYNAVPETCEAVPNTQQLAHPERFWLALSLNPYVVLADMVPARAKKKGDFQQTDMFAIISEGARQAQLPPDPVVSFSDCDNHAYDSATDQQIKNREEQVKHTRSVWGIGLSLQAALAAGALWGGYAKLRTPARRIAKGSRIA